MVDRRFGLLRLAAYALRAVAIAMLLIGLMSVFAFALALFQLFDFGPFLTSFTMIQAGIVMAGALGLAAVAEVYLVLLAIEENTRASAAAAYATAQAQQKQAEMAAALATIAQNTRFAADDLLKVGRLLEQLTDEQRRGQSVLPGLTTQLSQVIDQGRQDSARLATIETVARALAQRLLNTTSGGATD